MWKEFYYSFIHLYNRHGALCVLAYRIAHYLKVHHRYLGCPLILIYHILFRRLLSFDIHEEASIGRNFVVYHCFGIAVNPNVVIGDNCQMAHNTTIGSGIDGKCPSIGNNVTIAPSCSIIGDIEIGDNTIIGIGSVVVKSFPNNVVIAGNPAHIIKELKNEHSTDNRSL